MTPPDSLAPAAAVGAPVKRLEDARLLTGAGRYTDDVRVAGALHVAFLRSPHAHAEIRRIDSEAAKSSPGVVAVYVGADIEAAGFGPIPSFVSINGTDGKPVVQPPRWAIARGRVRHVGEIVAMVVADTLGNARDGAELVEVDYDSLPAVVDPAAAAQAGQTAIWDEAPGNVALRWERGDRAATDAAFAGAAKVVKLASRVNRIIANPIENRAIVADYDARADRVTLVQPSQGVHVLHTTTCDAVLKWPRERLRVQSFDVGGGFGPRFNLYPETPLMAWAARELRRPLRWTAERSEVWLSESHSRDHVAEAELALDARGRFVGYRLRTTANMGAYVSSWAPTIPTSGPAKVLTGLYAIPAAHLSVTEVFTNTVPVDAYRGAGKPEALFLLERLVDLAAREIGVDAGELRRRNLIPREAFPYVTPSGFTYESGDLEGLFAVAQALADVDTYAARVAASATQGMRRGRGYACCLHGTGGKADETSVVLAKGDGTVEAFTGTQSQGQGHETAFAQVVAAQLGLAVDKVRVVQGDTARIARGGGTGGSSSGIISSTTLRRAADALIVKARNLAADALEAAPADVVYEKAGSFVVVGTDRRIGLFELAARAEAGGAALDGAADFADRIESFPTGVIVAEVEVDPETGRVSLDRFAFAADCGVAINPLILDGQLHGGAAQGAAQALLENVVYDEHGQLLTGSLMDYGLPRADDLPDVATATLPTPSINNSLGMKGVGELGPNGAHVAVVNAAVDALKDLGVTHLEMPLSPHAVWRAIRAAG